MTFSEHSASNASSLETHPHAGHSVPGRCIPEEARLRVVTELATGGLLAVAGECLERSSQRSPQSTLVHLSLYASSVKTLVELNVFYVGNLGIVLKIVKQATKAAAAKLPKRARRAFAECLESAGHTADDYKGASLAQLNQMSLADARAKREATRLIEGLLLQLARQAALALSLVQSASKQEADHVWTVVATLLLAGMHACRAVEEAALGGAAVRDELVQLVEHSLASKLGPGAEWLISEVVSKLGAAEA